MHKTLICSLILSTVMMPNLSFAADAVSANVGITSNYIWRGVSQSDDKMSISAGADYSNDSGFYAGVWAASVDFNDDTNFEYDLYTGFQFDVDNITFDLGYLYYGYQGEDNLAFSETYLKASYQAITMAVSLLVDSDAGGDFADTRYFEASYDFSLPYDVALTVHAGYYDFKSGDNYQDFNIAVSKSGFSLMLSTLTGNDSLEDTLVALSYSKSFDF